jgi:hypothetical protein
LKKILGDQNKMHIGEERDAKKKKKDPADKALAHITYATSCFGTRAIPLLAPIFRALQSTSKVWLTLTDISFFVGLDPTTPHWLQPPAPVPPAPAELPDAASLGKRI